MESSQITPSSPSSPNSPNSASNPRSPRSLSSPSRTIACFQQLQTAATCPAATSCSNLHRWKQHFFSTNCLQTGTTCPPPLVLLAVGSAEGAAGAARKAGAPSSQQTEKVQWQLEMAIACFRQLQVAPICTHGSSINEPRTTKVELGVQLLTRLHRPLCNGRSSKSSKSSRSSTGRLAGRQQQLSTHSTQMGCGWEEFPNALFAEYN